MNITPGTIKEVLDNLTDSIEKEQAELYKKLIGDNLPPIDSVDNFYVFLIHPYDQFLRGLISVELKSSYKIQFLLLNSPFIESHFENWIKVKEGIGCCADKSRTIIKRLFNFLTLGEKITWDYDQEFTYHLPKKVFTSHDEIISFFEAINSLYYGNPEKYLKCIQDIIKAEPEPAPITVTTTYPLINPIDKT